jgi:hypothetical protein
VDVQVIREQLADRRALAGVIDGRRVPGLEEQDVGLGAGPGVAAEERLDVALKRQGDPGKEGALGSRP